VISVIIYTTGPDCMQCWATRKALDRAGIPFTTVDLKDPGNAEAREFVTSELGYSQAPVVLVDEEPENHWSGFRPDLISRLATRHVPVASDGRARQTSAAVTGERSEPWATSVTR
jgi:glutaredoxin-like protein NrdH